MKRDKLFEECLANVDLEDREYVRTQMDYQLMGLPTDEELDEWYDYDAIAEASARYIRNLAAQKLKEQKARDKQLIDMLIDELYTSRAYHLGITGLDSDAEIARKEREGDTALIRGIDLTIKYVRKAMEG